MSELSDKQLLALQYDWDFWRRPEQTLPPGKDWRWALYTMGRRSGKTRMGSEIILQQARQKRFKYGVIVNLTPTDAINVQLTGPSGIITLAPPWFKPKYNSVTNILSFPNGVQCWVGSGAYPDKFRGKEFDFAWLDELAFYEYPEATWEQLQICLCRRGPKGDQARGIITTTPQMNAVMQAIHSNPNIPKIYGSTMDNIDNLDSDAVNAMFEAFRGTSVERQELYGELLTENPGALWSFEKIEENRRKPPCEMQYTFIGVDPSIAAWGQNREADKKRKNDEVGIVAVGLGSDDNGYVLGDHSGSYPVDQWRDKLLEICKIYKNPIIVAEENQGGEMVRQLFLDGAFRRNETAPKIRLVRARQGKILRAQPISLAYERKRIFHIDTFPTLEQQMCYYTGSPKEPSPDRLDALVWASYAVIQCMNNYLNNIPKGAGSTGPSSLTGGRRFEWGV